MSKIRLFALNSQEKTQKAISENKFKNELIKLQINKVIKFFFLKKMNILEVI